MKKIILLLLFAILSLSQLEAKVNVEKYRKSMIGKWQFYREFCYRPLKSDDFNDY